ncbi:MAG TPA: M15 family metallopeptidase [Candidatus Limnocylindrales bacterium]|nr:M15 family metallopeptidase [Candidatus Limnocylindrales bacterium]
MRLARPRRALLLAAIIGSGLLALPGSGQPIARAVGPLPDCRLDDIYTEPRGYDDWATTQVDWILSVGKGYKPPDLVSISRAGVTGGGFIREVALKDLTAMATAARKAGSPLGSVSAYRSYQQQVALFNSYAGWNRTTRKYSNFDDAVTFSARPGHSEHQLGLVIDFAAAGSSTFVNEKTSPGRWLAKNAWKYGWLMSYPDGLDKQVCYHYEPWHYRYVGRAIAKKIHDGGTTIRQYLWANYTQLDAACVAAKPPPLKTPGTPRSCAIAEANPSAGPPAPGSSGVAASPGATGAFGGGNDATGSPAQPSSGPATALGQALPIGVGLVLTVLAVVAFASWRSSRRRRAMPRITRR